MEFHGASVAIRVTLFYYQITRLGIIVRAVTIDEILRQFLNEQYWYSGLI